MFEQTARTLNQHPLRRACGMGSQKAESALDCLGVVLAIDARLREFGNHAAVNPIPICEPAKHSRGRSLLLGQDAGRYLELQAVSESGGIDIGELQWI